MKITEAIGTIKSQPKRKFSESIDLDIALKLKDNQKKESIKGSATLPHTFGEDKKIVVLCEEADVAKAKKAGAIKAGLEDVKKELLAGFSDFDILIATPSVMPKIVELGKILGPKGLMPNPKNGTINADVVKAIETFKSGRTNFKMVPGQSAIRVRVAKLDMQDQEIEENITAMIKAVNTETKKLGPNAIKKVILKSTMGPRILVSVNDIIA